MKPGPPPTSSPLRRPSRPRGGRGGPPPTAGGAGGGPRRGSPARAGGRRGREEPRPRRRRAASCDGPRDREVGGEALLPRRERREVHALAAQDGVRGTRRRAAELLGRARPDDAVGS